MRYLFLGILIFIGLALVARVDILDKQGYWEEEKIPAFSTMPIFHADGRFFGEVKNGLGYSLLQMQPIISPEVDAGLDSLSHYLKEHNEKMLLLLSSFQPQEKEVQVAQFSSLGMARAYWLAQQMGARGISRSRFIFRDSLINNSQANFSELHIIAQPVE